MNKSYSKIRHIQEVNSKLERRTLNEQPLGGALERVASAGIEKNVQGLDTTAFVSNVKSTLDTAVKKGYDTKQIAKMVSDYVSKFLR